MKKIKKLATLLAAFAPLLFCGCTDEATTIVIDEAMLVGKWQEENNSQVIWRYDSSHTGETWDESEDVQEGEGTRFNWSTNNDMLQIDLYGEMGQHAYYDYTITKQTDSLFVWKDLYGNKQTFIKKTS